MDPAPGTTGRRILTLGNYSDCTINVHLAYHTMVKGGKWQWFNEDMSTYWKIKPGSYTTLSQDDWKINADYIKFRGECDEGNGVWNKYEKDALYVGNEGLAPSEAEGTYTYTFWSAWGISKFSDKTKRRYIKVENGTSETLTVWLGYHTKSKDGKWGWYDYNLQAKTWTIEPGKESLLRDGGFIINANVIRIKAKSSSGKTWGPAEVFIGEFTGDGEPYSKESPYVYRFVSADEEKHYNPATVSSYRDLANATNGRSFLAQDAQDLPGVIIQAFDSGLENIRSADNVDISLTIDTTSSMSDDIEAVKKELGTLLGNLKKIQSRVNSLRVGVVLYRDHYDEYVTRTYPFSSNLDDVAAVIRSIVVAGGGDAPEAVYDALFATLTELDWKGTKRVGILIGDAPPHPVSPEGYSHDTISALARKAGVNVNLYPIIVGI